MKQESEHWKVLDSYGLTAEEKKAVIAFIREVVQNVIDRLFGFTKAQEVQNDQ